MAMNTGTRVCHEQFGTGTVRMRFGRELLVNFDGRRGPALRVLSTEVTPVAIVPQPPAPTPEPEGVRPALAVAAASSGEAPTGAVFDAAPDTRVADLRLVEALRAGVVPAERAEAYTVGRAAVLRRLGDELKGIRDTGHGGFQVVRGGYGSGKSHLLEWLRERALAERFLVATATLGTHDASPAYPKRIYRAVVQGLSYPETPNERPGLMPLFERLAQTRRAPLSRTDAGYHRYFDAVAWYIDALSRAGDRGAAVRDELIDWIEGHPSGDNTDWNTRIRHATLRAPYLYALPDFRTFGHVYAYLIGGLAVFAREAGWAGVVVLFDEAEKYALLEPRQRAFADEVFRCYAVAALGKHAVRFDADKMRLGGQPIHRGIPLRYGARQPLLCVFCVTPAAGDRQMLDDCVDLDRHLIDLQPLGPDDYAQLVARVADLFDRLHPGCRPTAAQLDTLARVLSRGAASGRIGNPRAAIRVLIEGLDVARMRPDHLARFLTELAAAV